MLRLLIRYVRIHNIYMFVLLGACFASENNQIICCFLEIELSVFHSTRLRYVSKHINNFPKLHFAARNDNFNVVLRTHSQMCVCVRACTLNIQTIGHFIRKYDFSGAYFSFDKCFTNIFKRYSPKRNYCLKHKLFNVRLPIYAEYIYFIWLALC